MDNESWTAFVGLRDDDMGRGVRGQEEGEGWGRSVVLLELS